MSPIKWFIERNLSTEPLVFSTTNSISTQTFEPTLLADFSQEVMLQCNDNATSLQLEAKLK